MVLLELMKLHQKELTAGEMETLSMLVEVSERIPDLNIIELANEVHTSKSSLLRLTKKLGFSGYSEFKYYLKRNSADKKWINQDLLKSQQQDIEETQKILGQIDLLPLVKKIYKAKKIYCYGTGYAQKNALNEFFMSILFSGKNALFLPSKTEFDMQMPLINKEDIVVVVSLSGQREEIKENVLMLNARNIPYISVTNFSQNFLASHTALNLFFYASPIYIPNREHELFTFLGLHIALDTLFRVYTNYSLLQELEDKKHV